MPAGIGLMTETRMDAVDFVKWDTTNPRLIVWKFPSDQLATWTQLIVNDSQQAWLVHEGILFPKPSACPSAAQAPSQAKSGS